MRKRLTWIATALVVPTAAVLGLASPASAATVTGLQNDFYSNCDAIVMASDALIGSPYRIEAWGGFSCMQPTVWGGDMRITLYRDGAKVAENEKHVNEIFSGEISTGTDNVPGTQRWKVDIWLFRPRMTPALVSTGELLS